MRAIALALRQRHLRLLLSAGLISLTGDWILRVGLAYYVYALTGNTLASALMLLASFIPQIVLGSLAGVFVDRWDLRRTMVTANVLLALGLLPLLAVHRPGQIWIVYAVTAWEGCVQQFFTPAQQSLLPRLVGDEHLVTANALNSQNSDLSRLIGSALGGAAAAAGGISLLALLDAASFLVSASLIAAIPTAPRAERTPTAHPELRARLRQLRTDWADGMRLSLHQHVLRVIVIFLLVTSVGEGIMSTLFAPFVRSVLHASAETYGLIVAAQAIGGIGGGLLAASIGNRLPATRAMGWAAIAFGLIDLALFLYPLQLAAAWPAIVLMILVGFPGALTVTSVMTLLQRHTTDSHRGRIFGALGAAEGIAFVAGTCAAGFLGRSLGIIPMLAAQGGGYVLAGMLLVVLLRHDSAGHTAPERRTHESTVGH
ncbi:MFS transporter [Streptomyces sp. NPDC101152]|uniref:MFS transporter n=1 Tax=Streptomyces sp. NPDC101152 TaxID=3366116 RepID=UPI0037FCACBC